ncbi:MAG TPA: SpoIIE family protein phosphatase [Verrucomicrobiae bacterium]|nr:SpoIIE family protein phosphatase [Verrucomicrobiae bacterium]
MVNGFMQQPERAIDWSFASRPLPGEKVSGDLHVVHPFTQGVLVAVVDGLGHGQEATAAARTAAHTFTSHADQSIISLIKRCHEALAKTRGATITVASLNVFDGTMTWLGIGPVEGHLLRADARANPPTEVVLLRGGVVGYQLPALQASLIPLFPGDLLILASDGIRSGFSEGLTTTDPPQQIAERILSAHFKGNDDALVLVVRYLGLSHEGSAK